MAKTETPELVGQPRTEEHVVIFRLADEFYALDIQTVQEIVRMQAITSIPGSDFWVEGITNLRGRVVPVIDLRKRCGVEAREYSAETRIVVVSSASGMVGLIVDAVSEVMRIPGEQVEPPSTIVSGIENTYLRGVAKLDERLVSLVDLEGVLPAGESEFAFASQAA
ncbi:MAG TPA: chemotaxis protein CheW [Tepidiformaceae bacterium]|nr:chemotaxis protein CheW [Tepidiformaceae bacterium]HMO96375.1 chemotaxis protein CheW [Tepidiformaceae bacterium]